MSEERDPALSEGAQIDPEVMAAFLDGRLNDRERSRVLEILSSSEADQDVLADAAVVMEDLAPHGGQDDLARRRSRVKRAILAVAAMIGTVALVPLVTNRTAAPSEDAWRSVSELSAALGAGAGVEAFGARWESPGWSEVRSGTNVLDEFARSYRLGVLFAQVQTAIALDDESEARAVTGRMRPLLEPIPGGGLVSQELMALLENGGFAGAPSGAWDSVHETLVLVAGDEAALNLGVWVEIARLGALAGPAESPLLAALRGRLSSHLDALTPASRARLDQEADRLAGMLTNQSLNNEALVEGLEALSAVAGTSDRPG